MVARMVESTVDSKAHYSVDKMGERKVDMKVGQTAVPKEKLMVASWVEMKVE